MYCLRFRAWFRQFHTEERDVISQLLTVRHACQERVFQEPNCTTITLVGWLKAAALLSAILSKISIDVLPVEWKGHFCGATQ
jgi:hypothetical protein